MTEKEKNVIEIRSGETVTTDASLSESESVITAKEEDEAIKCEEGDSAEISFDNGGESDDVGEKDGCEYAENNADAEKNIPVFMRDDWKRRVEDFEEEYPIAKRFGKEMGEMILASDTLRRDGDCLYKALLKVMSDRYLPDAEKAKDEEFLQNYIYADEDIVAKIVEDYLDSFDERRLPKTMTKGGQISLTRPNRPSTISEAGRIAERIMKR